MFLRAKIRHKDGKAHRAWSVVENRQPGSGAWPRSPVRAPRRPEKRANYFAKIMSELTPFPTCAIGQMAHGET
jgi:hypothetical protein